MKQITLIIFTLLCFFFNFSYSQLSCTGSFGAPIVNITFGSGTVNPGPELSSIVPGASTNYNYASYGTGTPPAVIFDGDYALINQIPNNGAWFVGANDHTGNPNGYMAFFNSAPSPGEFYRQTITSLCPGTTYEFSAWVANAINPAVLPNAIRPNITFDILNSSTQAILATYNTGDMPAPGSFTWNKYSLLFTSPTSISSVTLVLKNNNIGGTADPGNDLAIDDISFRPCGPLTKASFSISTSMDSSSTTNCSSINFFGKITGSLNDPSYQWQVSNDGGVTYLDIPGATSLNGSYSNLTNKTYLFRMLSAESGNINSVTCRFISNEIKLTVTGCANKKSVIVNQYTPVLSYNPCNNSLAVEDASKYNTGDTVVIMQMKGAIIDSSNTSTFGTITDYKNAGNYEFNYVKSKIGNMVELKNNLLRQYDLPDGKVQLIRVPYFQDYTTTDTVTCLPWDGRKGGVVVLNVKNTLTLSEPVDVSGKGFRGGQSQNPKNNSYYCHENDYYYPNDQTKASPKGEGVTELSDSKSFGKGNLANGGGGGLEHNSGGGGGANVSNGGNGGDEWITCGPPSPNGGLGGEVLNYSNTLNKVFLGGGGGAGHCDNIPGFNSNGGNGGGIIIINCSFLNSLNGILFANGSGGVECTRDNQAFKCHEGMGGGGAAGSVLINCPNIVGNLSVNTNGGKGADMNGELAGKLGPGGGGGGGLLWTSSSSLPVGTTHLSNGGISGVNIDFGLDSYGANKGLDGKVLFDLKLPFAANPFKPQIDSVRAKSTSTSCNSVSLNGFIYPANTSVIKWDWIFDDNTQAAGPNTTHVFSATGNHPVKLVVTSQDGCKDSVTIIITTSNVIAPPVFTVTQPSCVVTSGSLNVSAPLALGIQYSIDGINFQSSPQFTGLTVNSYALTVKDLNSQCASLPVNFNIMAPLIPTTASYLITQPTCANPTGKITITLPTGTSLQYSIDGSNFQADAAFDNTAPGSYNLTVKDTVSKCVSNVVTAVVNAPPANPATPILVVNQPVCANDKGNISISSPLGAGFQYSIDSVNYQANAGFTNLLPGSYSVTVKNSSNNCISATSLAVINAGTGTPPLPTVIITTQPNCLITTGSAIVTSPVGNNYAYSFNGSAYQSNAVFSSLAMGAHSFTVKNITNGCISNAMTININAVPNPPVTPIVDIKQPNCDITTGTITIQSPLGNNLQFSINGSSYQSLTSFSNVNAGTYNITAKDTSTQCVSSQAIAIVNPVPAPPNTPTLTDVTQPTCKLATGSASVNTPTGSNFEYRIDGGAFDPSSILKNLQQGTHQIVVRDVNTKCVSLATTLIINPPPPLPPTPAASIIAQPTCVLATGAIRISYPLGSNYEYSLDGLTYQSSTVFNNLGPGTYSISVKDPTIECTSSPFDITLSVNTSQAGMYKIPSAFSPNFDGINDCFGIKYWGVINDFKMTIFNRYGQAVFSTTNPGECWNGMYKGVKALAGNYVYVIKANTYCGPVEKKGNVLLLR